MTYRNERNSVPSWGDSPGSRAVRPRLRELSGCVPGSQRTLGPGDLGRTGGRFMQPRLRRGSMRARLRRIVVRTLGIGLVPGSAAEAASETAQYNVRFEATWSAATHPIDFPTNAHFSPLIGGTHDAAVRLWGDGVLASQGIKDMAERGLTSPLDLEVEAAIGAGHAGVVIRGGNIPSSPGTATASFTISQAYPLVTLVSMVAPSPDWFVGVSGLPLLRGGAWTDSLTVQLAAYDAGTDCGTTFTSPNCVSNPPEPIAPNAAPAFANGVPLGTFTFIRIPTPTDARTPTRVLLAQSYPNPARDGMSVQYSLPRAAHARLVVYDAAGRALRTLADGVTPAGEHTVRW